MHISIEQAIDVYNDLIDAKNGVHGFGGSVAEIYVHRLMPNSPGYNMNPTGGIFDEDNRMLEKKAAEDFHSLCYIFAKKHSVQININDVDLHEWISMIRKEEARFYWRVHVEVKKLSEEKHV
jgi:hypothetical protein